MFGSNSTAGADGEDSHATIASDSAASSGLLSLAVRLIGSFPSDGHPWRGENATTIYTPLLPGVGAGELTCHRPVPTSDNHERPSP